MLTIEKVHAEKTHKFKNKLIEETSPYLLQHAHNPVNWYPWGEEAFEKARKENKPVILSIGYSTCHWCHVMEHESFEDIEIANFMNKHFVSIKVDREQRPDIDSIYMTVVQSMTGHGGWPMTVWLTPDQEPFYGGTYFPAREGDRGRGPGFLQLIQRLSDLYQQHPEDIKTRAKQIAEEIKSHIQRDQSGKIPSSSVFDQAFSEFEKSYDTQYGGFGYAPKFPRPCALQFLLHYGARTGNAKATAMAVDTLKAMLKGGIYDQICGGFHRYSVDTYWLVSHFEKMLYDQSQIVLSLLDAWQITKDPEFKRVAIETLDYISREMTDPSGGFYSATDADSEGVEGKFFIWDEIEILSTLDESVAPLFLEYYGVTPHGNFEEKNIFFIKETIEEFAQRKKLDFKDTQEKILSAKKTLLHLRSKRIPPLTDDKVITAWNGLMIGAFARAGFVFDMPEYVSIAKAAANFVLQNLFQHNELFRSARHGKINTKAFLDDYSCLIFGLLELFEATGETHCFDQAKKLQDIMNQKFWDSKEGGFFSSSEDVFFAREKPSYDGAEPSGNSISAWNLLRFASFLKDESFLKKAEGVFQNFSKMIENNPTFLPQMLVALDYFYGEAKEIVLVNAKDEDCKLFQNVLRQTYLPNRVLVQVDQAQTTFIHESIREKSMGKKSAAYVCADYVCEAPAFDAETFQKMLKKS